jgi:transducin (beta)-like 1
VSSYILVWELCLTVTFSSSFDGTARLWDSVTGHCLKIFGDHKRPVYTLSYSPDGYWLATGGGDGWLHIYNVDVSDLH